MLSTGWMFSECPYDVIDIWCYHKDYHKKPGNFKVLETLQITAHTMLLEHKLLAGF